MGMLETAARRRLGPQQRRSQLVAVGMTLLRDRPLGDLALEDVAAAAGVSRALPYHYFGTRGEFLIAVLEATAGDFLQATDPAPDRPPLERLRAGIGAYVDWVGARPSEFPALTRSAAGAGPARRLRAMPRCPGGPPHAGHGRRPGWPRRRDQAAAGRTPGPGGPGTRRRGGRHLAGQHVSRLPVRRSVESVLVLVRAESGLDQHLPRAAGTAVLSERCRHPVRTAPVSAFRL